VFVSTYFFIAPQSVLGKYLLIIEFSRSHSDTQHGRFPLGGLLVQRRDL